VSFAQVPCTLPDGLADLIGGTRRGEAYIFYRLLDALGDEPITNIKPAKCTVLRHPPLRRLYLHNQDDHITSSIAASAAAD